MRTTDMNNFGKLSMNKLLVNVRLAMTVALLAFVTGNTAYAEDIEIYRGITESDIGDLDTTRVLKPNLLFVLDTSGSMRETELVTSKTDYDPGRIYGGGALNDKYYLYDENNNYTNNFFSENDNHCQASKDFINDAGNASFPGYFDRVLLWESVPSQPISGVTCVANDAIEYNEEVNVNKGGGYKRFDQISINTTDNYSLQFTTEAYSGTVDYEYRDSSNTQIGGYFCAQSVSPNSDYVCNISSADTPADAVSIFVWFIESSNTDEDNTKARITLTNKKNVCTPNTIPAEGNWQDKFTSTVSGASAVAIECKADDGIHGSTGAASGTDIYAQYQTDVTNAPTEPRYTSLESAGNNVTWSADTVTNKYIYPGNYHEFLNTSIEELVGASSINTPATGDTALQFCRKRTTEVNTDPDFNFNESTYFNSDEYVYGDGGRVFQCVSRIKTLKVATERALTGLKNANVGMMRMNVFGGGSLIVEVDDIEAPGHKQKLIDAVNNLPAAGATPLQETMASAYRYYAGDNVAYKNDVKTIPINADIGKTSPRVKTTKSDLTPAAAKQGNKYISPIGQCEDNSIILLSDGAPSADVGDVTLINNLSNKRTDSNKPAAQCVNTINGDCLDDLTGAMANVDVFSKASPDLTGKNLVYTYTVAFGSGISNSGSTGNQVLKDASDAALRFAGSKQHFNAVDSDELTTAFKTITASLGLVTNDSFVSPAVAVNAFNRLQFRNDLYFALFKPENSFRWNGNIKKFNITPSGDIIGRDGVDAIGNDGFFKAESKSFWQPKNNDGSLSTDADGPIVTKGGVANQLDIRSTTRKFYVKLDPTSTDATLLDESNFTSSIVSALAAGTSGVVDTVTGGLIGPIGALPNGLISNGAGNVVPDLGQIVEPDLQTNTDNIVKWTLGKDVNKELGGTATDPNYFLGESLHGTPFVADYGVAGTANDVLFFTTNQGLLHAINGGTGEERWAYMPDTELLPNLGAYYNNQVSDNHKYGLDGEISFSVKRKANGKVDEAFMYMGQRRGGSKYFAIDVSNAALDDTTKDPVKSLWTLEGLPRMGQSWARPVPAVVNYCTTSTSCSETKVLFISGGYDIQYDELVDKTDGSGSVVVDAKGNTLKEPRSMSSLSGSVNGNAMYMVRQSTGELLWMAGQNDSQVDTSVAYLTNADMTHAFPSEPTPVDSDFDGVIDFMYAVDIAGRVWRFDFSGDVTVTDPPTGSAQPPLVEIDENDIVVGNNNINKETAGGVIANMSDLSENRRFYNRLDISLTKRTETDLAKFNIVTGSGYRGHPLTFEEYKNRLYFVYDRNIRFPKFTADANGLPDTITYNYAAGDKVIAPTDFKKKVNGIALNTSPQKGSTPAGANHHGFYVELDSTSSEKMLNPTLTDAGIVLGVSYSPEAIVTDAGGNLCNKNAGSSSLYQVDLLTGEFVKIVLDKSGISAKPVIIEVAIPEPTPDPIDPSNPPTYTPPTPDPLTNKILIIGSEAFDGSGVKPRGTPPPAPGDPECDPRLPLCLEKPDTGDVNKVNWWERRR